MSISSQQTTFKLDFADMPATRKLQKTHGPATESCPFPSSFWARLCFCLIPMLTVMLLCCGCGLIFKDKPAPRPRSNMSAEVESSAQPLPYKVKFVLVTDDGREVLVPEKDKSADKKQGEDEKDGKNEKEESSKNGKDAPTNDSHDDPSTLSAAEDLARQQKEEEAPAVAAPNPEVDGPNLVKGMQKLSQLVRLHETPPDGELGLEMRARQDVDAALKYMASEGYYDGAADFGMSIPQDGKASVTIYMRPGRRYVVGDISIIFTPYPEIPAQLAKKKNFLFAPDRLPRIRKGRPVTASEVLESVQKLPVRLHNNGFPDARIVGEYYYLDRSRKTLNILVEIEPGAPATFGKVVFYGESSVSGEYLAKHVPWTLREPVLWDERKVDRYVAHLRRTGLFSNVTLVNEKDRGPADNNGSISQKNIGIALEDAKHRTVGGMLRYETDTGLGAEAHWEHRNLFGSGEKLSLTAPYTSTNRGLEMEFRKPAFITRTQLFRVKASAMDETSDAYERTGVNAEAGLVRFWNRHWITFSGLFTDTGWLKNNEHDRQAYTIYCSDLRLRRDTRDNRMNPVSGSKADLRIKPMSGQYSGDFSAVGTEFSLTGYWAPFKRRSGRPSDKLVFAGKAGFGAFNGAQLRNIPSTQRYFLGGMDTVRGYGYQQIGPMDSNGDPTGGRSYQLINLEARYKLTDSLGLVGFLDGGQLYTSEWPEFNLDMDWGAGIGVRYYTPIGPVRFDVAMPLKEEDPPVQFYISIGQSF